MVQTVPNSQHYNLKSLKRRECVKIINVQQRLSNSSPAQMFSLWKFEAALCSDSFEPIRCNDSIKPIQSDLENKNCKMETIFLQLILWNNVITVENDVEIIEHHNIWRNLYLI